ncbi:hypothetical protein H9Q16_05850 [Sulfitobacter sp. TSTF-M16]|uniref:Uncharacterized protein n=1 Tax=Sulfitobacter aestuariivivens TaxID=2766981 RepID=A0A927D5Z7_9RHOB|nr:hypothetical protein [Sulfitobacter aestuariivivens]MBD3663436.1 hypothetical protein [Sulfitobacter aestuariivivens]
MNMNRIINMVIRQVMNQLIRRGMRAGFDKAGQVADRRKAARGEPVKTPQDMTPQERKQMRAERQQARRAQQGLKTARRMSRF